MNRLGLAGRIRMLAAMAMLTGRTPQEAIALANMPPLLPGPPEDPTKATTMKTADDMEVELPQRAPTVLRTDHAAQAILKAQHPTLNRKQRRRLLARLQIQQTNSRLGVRSR